MQLTRPAQAMDLRSRAAVFDRPLELGRDYRGGVACRREGYRPGTWSLILTLAPDDGRWLAEIAGPPGVLAYAALDERHG